MEVDLFEPNTDSDPDVETPATAAPKVHSKASMLRRLQRTPAKKMVKKNKPSLSKKCSAYFEKKLKWLEAKRKEKFLVSLNSPYKTQWDLVIMVCATYNSF
jgi:hypothetical protein